MVFKHILYIRPTLRLSIDSDLVLFGGLLFKLSRIEKEFSSLSFAIIVAILFLLTGSNIIPGIAGVLLWLIIGLTFISTTKLTGKLS